MDPSQKGPNVDASMKLIAQAGACIHGFDGMADLFAQLEHASETGFRNVPHSLTPYVDDVVVWRVVDGQIHEAWDIPAVNTVRAHSVST